MNLPIRRIKNKATCPCWPVRLQPWSALFFFWCQLCSTLCRRLCCRLLTHCRLPPQPLESARWAVALPLLKNPCCNGPRLDLCRFDTQGIQVELPCLHLQELKGPTNPPRQHGEAVLGCTKRVPQVALHIVARKCCFVFNIGTSGNLCFLSLDALLARGSIHAAS